MPACPDADRIPLPPGVPAGTAAAAGEAGAAALEGTIAPALTACEAALARCLKLTSGTALPALARVLDRAAQQYVSALQAAVAGMRRRLGEGGGGGDGGADSAEAVLPLLTVASQLVQRLALLEGSLRQAGAEVAPALLDGTADVPQEGQLPGAAALRLQAQLALRQQLAAFAASAASSAALLPLAAAAAAELEAGVGSCVLEVLTQRPRAQLAGLPRLGEWQQRAGALLLPTFSAYPLQYVTSGEWGWRRWPQAGHAQMDLLLLLVVVVVVVCGRAAAPAPRWLACAPAGSSAAVYCLPFERPPPGRPPGFATARHTHTAAHTSPPARLDPSLFSPPLPQCGPGSTPACPRRRRCSG